MKKYIVIVLSFFSFQVFSQVNHNAFLTYKVITMYDTDSTLTNFVAENCRKTKPLEYTLAIDGDSSEFFQKVNLEIEDSDKKASKIRKIISSFGIEKVYTNNNSIFIVKNVLNQDFLIKNEISSLKWQILNESKPIDGDTCFKATTQFETLDKKGDLVLKEITAYYNPKYNWRQGPFGFCNLPGLIVEVSDGSKWIILTKIELDKKELNTFDFKTLNELKSFSSEIEFEKFITEIRKNN